MPVNHKFLAARAAERRFRDIAHLRRPATIRLRRHDRPLALVPLVPLTLRHKIELRLQGNAFFNRREITGADVFAVLWRLNPNYAAPVPGREQLVENLGRKRLRLLRLRLALGSFLAAFTHRRLTGFVRLCDLDAAVAAVDEFLMLSEQDAPSADADRVVGPAAPDRHHADNLTDFLMGVYGMSHDQALDFPLAVAHQLYRERVLSMPDGELAVFAPSDALLSA